MKPIVFIPPAIALILAGAWIVPQRSSMAVLETECTRLRSTIAAAELPSLDSMSRKDPAAALGLLESRGMMQSYVYQHLISDTLQAWALKDPAAAGGWFDGQIATGTFDSKTLNGVSDSRQMLESAFIRILLGSSPEAAARRLAALPEVQRGDVMSMYSLTIVPVENQLAHASLIRAQVPVKDQAETIASQVPFLVKRGDYSAATAYLDRIAATPAERAASVMKAIRDMYSKNPYSDKLTREDFNALREWAGSQSPESVDKVTA